MFLAFILLVCVLAILFISLLPTKDESAEQMNLLCNRVALGASLIILGLASYLFFFGFDNSQSGLQMVYELPWFGNISSFKLGVDGLSLPMVFIAALMLPLIIVSSKNTSLEYSPKLYYSLIFLLFLSVFGVFLAQDLLLFFLFWELELLPTYLLISRWGKETSTVDKSKASNKFLLFTFISGALILAGTLALFTLAKIVLSQPGYLDSMKAILPAGTISFSLVDLSAIFDYLPSTLQLATGDAISSLSLLNAVFILFLIAFSIKLPSIPFHNWLPDVHKSASIPVSMIVAGILFIMGSYGLMRFGIEFFGLSIAHLKYYLAGYGALNIVIGGFFALIQKDLRGLIAYSNISHLGFIILALASFNSISINGAIFHTVAHALIAVGLFYVVMLVFERSESYDMDQIGGLAPRSPKLFFFATALAMVTLGLPLLIGFVGESLVFYGIFMNFDGFSPLQLWGIVAGLGVVLTAAYMLYMIRKVFFGPAHEEGSLQFASISKTDITVLSIIMFFCILWGSFPSLLERKMEASISSQIDSRLIQIYKGH